MGWAVGKGKSLYASNTNAHVTPGPAMTQELQFGSVPGAAVPGGGTKYALAREEKRMTSAEREGTTCSMMVVGISRT